MTKTNVTFGCRGYHQSGVIHEFKRTTDYDVSDDVLNDLKDTITELKKMVAKVYKNDADGMVLTVNGVSINVAHYSAIEFILEEEQED